MRQKLQYKSVFINHLHILDETFETNETVFQRFSVLSLFFHIFNSLFPVSFCLIQSHFSLILSHSVSFQKSLNRKIINLHKNTNKNYTYKNDTTQNETSGNFYTNEKTITYVTNFFEMTPMTPTFGF